ncbi:MAG: hypothetical protein GXP55_24745 [Deltaproteobacteria bacterium]|nr:hypothetical protein [Deltaproteobacteria bacterium]
MDVIPLMIFICLALVVLAVGFFAFSVKEHTFEHSDRLELLPLLDDDPKPVATNDTGTTTPVEEHEDVPHADHGGTASTLEE